MRSMVWINRSLHTAIVIVSLLVALAGAQTPAPEDGTSVSPAKPTGSGAGSDTPTTNDDAEKGSGISEATNKTLDDIRDGKLSRYGITAGASIAVQVPLKDGTDQKPVLSAMPYIQFMPFIYIVRGHIARSYCVAKVLEGSSAQAAADGAALLDAGFASAHIESSDVITVEQWKLLQSALKDGAKDAKTKISTIYKSDSLESTDIISQITTLETDLKAGPIKADSFAHKEQLDLLVRLVVFQNNGWWLGVPAAGCWARFLPGFYVGLPAEFSANSNVSSGTGSRVSTEFKPVVSFGLAFSFTSFAQLMIGLTVSNVVDEKMQNTSVWSGTISFGGNLDILGALFGK